MSVNVTQYKPTFDERQGKGFVDYAKRFEITPADLVAGAFKIPVTPGEVVIGVRAQVLTAWDGAASCAIGVAGRVQSTPMNLHAARLSQFRPVTLRV